MYKNYGANLCKIHAIYNAFPGVLFLFFGDLPRFRPVLGKVPGFKVGPSPISPFFGEGHNTSFFLYL